MTGWGCNDMQTTKPTREDYARDLEHYKYQDFEEPEPPSGPIRHFFYFYELQIGAFLAILALFTAPFVLLWLGIFLGFNQ